MPEISDEELARLRLLLERARRRAGESFQTALESFHEEVDALLTDLPPAPRLTAASEEAVYGEFWEDLDGPHYTMNRSAPPPWDDGGPWWQNETLADEVPWAAAGRASLAEQAEYWFRDRLERAIAGIEWAAEWAQAATDTPSLPPAPERDARLRDLRLRLAACATDAHACLRPAPVPGGESENPVAEGERAEDAND